MVIHNTSGVPEYDRLHSIVIMLYHIDGASVISVRSAAVAEGKFSASRPIIRNMRWQLSLKR